MNGEASQAGTVWLDHQQAAGFEGVGPDFQPCAESRLVRRVQFIAQTEKYNAGWAEVQSDRSTE
jgi:hypothetical protein